MAKLSQQGPSVTRRKKIQERIFNGYAYQLARTKGLIKYLRCRNFHTGLCRGRGTLVNGIFRLTRRHNHPENATLDIINTFSEQLYREVTSTLRSIDIIYENLKILYPEAASLLNEETVLRTMRRWRNKMEYPKVSSFKDFHSQLYSENWKFAREYGSGTLEISLKMEGRQGSCLTFFDTQFLQRLASSTVFTVCSTTPVIPTGIEETIQTAMIIAIYENFALPCAIAWMRTRSSSAYNALLEPLKGRIHPRQIYADFEERLRNQLRTTFPTSLISGDFYSYCRAILQEAKKFNTNIEADDASQAFIKNILALALLPADQIPIAWALIKTSHSEHIIQAFGDFLQGFEQTWLCTVTPEKFTFFDDLHALRDCTMSIRKVMENSIVDDKKDPWNFIRAILKMQNRSSIDLEIIDRGKIPSVTPRVRYVVDAAGIARAWRMLDSNTITIKRFLKLCESLIEPLLAELLFNKEPGDIDLEVCVPAMRRTEEVNNAGNRRLPEVIDYDTLFPPVNWHVIDDQESNDEEVIEIDGKAPFDLVCVVCKVRFIEYICVPCMHLITCKTCAEIIIDEAKRNMRRLSCPLCRENLTKICKTYILGNSDT